MIDMIGIFNDTDNLNKHLRYLEKVTSKKPYMKNINKFINNISLETVTENVYLSNHNKKILENLEKVFQENKQKISCCLYQTFYHEFGHMYTALANGFDFSVIILNAHTKFHIFYLENEKSTNLLYCSFKKEKPSITRSSRGVAIFPYKDYLNDHDIHYKVSLIAISGFIAQKIYNNRNLLSTLINTRGSLFRSFGIERRCKLKPIKYFLRRVVNIGSDADLIVDHMNSLERKERQAEIDFIDKLNNIHDSLYHNSGNVENYSIYPIEAIAKKIQKNMTSTSKIKF